MREEFNERWWWQIWGWVTSSDSSGTAHLSIPPAPSHRLPVLGGVQPQRVGRGAPRPPCGTDCSAISWAPAILLPGRAVHNVAYWNSKTVARIKSFCWTISLKSKNKATDMGLPWTNKNVPPWENAVCSFAFAFFNTHNSMECACGMCADVCVITSFNSGLIFIFFLNLLLRQHVSFNFHSVQSFCFTALLYSSSSLDVSLSSSFFFPFVIYFLYINIYVQRASEQNNRWGEILKPFFRP